MKARAARTLRNWLDELKVAEECNLPRGPSLTCPPGPSLYLNWGYMVPNSRYLGPNRG